jgi:AcrR family transcriptional regulator
MAKDRGDGRTRKRLATRQRISDAATQLFMEHGFDDVTVDEIAEAAQVSRMTVFNHFARKEDMMFDLDDVSRGEVVAAIENRGAGVGPVEALRLFAHQAVAERRPYLQFAEGGTDRFVATVERSHALMARARAIRDELTEMVAVALAKAAGRREPDGIGRLAASLLVSTWVVAFAEAHRTFAKRSDARKAHACFLAIIDQGSAAVERVVHGTPYA